MNPGTLMPRRARLTVIATATLTLGALMLPARASAADKQIRPFLGTTFGGGTSIVDPDNAVSRPSFVWGVSFVTLGEIFGVDAELASAPGFFSSPDQRLVTSSNVTTLTGSLVIAVPRRWTEYVLRPYAVAGGGLMRVRYTTVGGVFDVAQTMPAFDLGAGVVTFLTNRVGGSFEVRRFENLNQGTQLTGQTIGPTQLSFWRATMSLAIRY